MWSIVVARPPPDLNLPLGSKLHLGLHDYAVVGLTRGMVESSGDPVAFFSLADAQEIQFVKDNWAIRDLRERANVTYAKALPTQPSLSAQMAKELADNPDLHTVNAILVDRCTEIGPSSDWFSRNRWPLASSRTPSH
jgi:hypothetical protein